MKTLILDTNVLLTDPDSLYAFEDNEIIIPFTILEELDKIKSRTNEVGANAREVARRLAEMISDNESGALKRGATLPSGGRLRLVAVSDFEFDEDEKLGKDWDLSNKDNHILDVCRGLARQHREEGKEPPILVSRDILLRVKCDFLGIPCEDYLNSHVTQDIDHLYTGSTLIDVTEEDVQKYWESSENPNREFHLNIDKVSEHSLVPNQFILLQDPNSSEELAVRYVDKNKPLTIVHDIKAPVYGLLPRNKEQNLAMNLLLEPDIKLVTILGHAGTGKTIAALAAGLNQVIEKKRYKRLFICRPIVPVGNDIGFLPGEKSEKLEPWIAPIKDNLRYLLFSGTAGRKSRQNEMSFNGFFEDGLIEIEAITYLRGRSIADAYVIIDECFPYSQNINTENGKMPIGKLVSLFNKGEKIPKVLAYDEKNKNFVYKNVKNAWSNGYKSLIKIKSSNRTIECTENHPFLVKDKGYVKARELSVGDLLVTTKPKARSQLLKTWNEDQEQIILGSYLGAGNISKNGLNRYRLKVVHGEAQKNYCQFKSDTLNSFTSQVKQNGYSKRPAIKFTTLMFGSKINFDSNKKTCSLEILNKLNPKGLAIWFMDDGSVYPDKNGARISTCSFDEESQKNFVNYFHSLGMKNVKYKEYYSKSKDKSYYCLIFNKEDYYKLSSLIEPYTHPELSYKVINQNLVGTYKWNSYEEESGVTVVDAIDLNPEISKEVFDIEVEDLHNFVICSTRASKNNSGIVVHNCQNLTAHELKTIITRVGENTKIVLTGDIDQIDNMYINAKSNGLTIAIEKFKPYSIAGHIKLVKGERSELASLAAKCL